MRKWAKEPKSFEELISFYNEIRRKTLDHEVIGGSACVSAKSLGESLEKIDKEWWRGVNDE